MSYKDFLSITQPEVLVPKNIFQYPAVMESLNFILVLMILAKLPVAGLLSAAACFPNDVAWLSSLFYQYKFRSNIKGWDKKLRPSHGL